MNGQTASGLEIAAAIINIFGFGVACLMLHLTLRRYRAVKSQPEKYPTGRELLAAWRHFRCETGRMAMHAGSFSLGLWAMTLPSGETWYGFAAMMFRVSIGLLYLMFSLWDVSTDSQLWDQTGIRRRLILPRRRA